MISFIVIHIFKVFFWILSNYILLKYLQSIVEVQKIIYKDKINYNAKILISHFNDTKFMLHVECTIKYIN